MKNRYVNNSMMQKKILIIVPGFSIGGTIVSLQSLLSFIDTEKYKIDIFALGRSGVYLDKMPNCSILPENIWLSYRYHGSNIFKKIFVKTLRVIRIGLSKVGINIVPILARIGSNRMDTMQYDAVVSYSESINNIVCFYKAKKRIAWVHCEYSRMLNISGIRSQYGVYKRFDNIVCVSKFAKQDFCSHYPNLEPRVSVINNIIDTERIRSLAKETDNLDERYDNSCFTIVSAGRLDPVKQFDKIPQVASRIKSLISKPFKWYIIGGARGFEQMEEELKKDIIKYSLEENVILLGEKTNVYPYMAGADLYVSLSLSESFPLVINEAKALGLPIVSTNFGSVAESVQNGVEGHMDSLLNMPTQISYLIENVDIFEQLKKNLFNFYYDNEKIIGHVESIL